MRANCEAASCHNRKNFRIVLLVVKGGANKNETAFDHHISFETEELYVFSPLPVTEQNFHMCSCIIPSKRLQPPKSALCTYSSNVHYVLY
ncbi:hypothetical protein PAHAL_9G387000 [Panicum hallii]|jgi:hypothetical protein|uniref:Uncharacterized protein n=1 Tax=Panicum hallii TaxID=206008 RepID=A0A2T8I3Y2_9POAL|nr:hypothetical protein PAHAL_9G387000 [Panicum hallii]